MNNQEITNNKKRKEYKEKLHQYISGSKSDFGFYLIFKVKPTKSHNNKYFRKLKEDHKDIDNLTVEVFDCVRG